MIIGCCFICVFAVLINKVCLQVTVEGVIGGSVVLPCFSSEDDLKPQDINVHWRHNFTLIVCDIIQGNDSVVGQNLRYKNRAETFPDGYLRGNFSIKLNNIQHTDAGEFSCFITLSSDSKEETVQLLISDSAAEKGNTSTDQENPGETGTDSVGISRHWVIIPVVLFIIMIIVSLIFFLRKKRGQSLL